MGKPATCIGENKDADQLRGNREADQRQFVFATRIVQFLFYLNPKFQASRSFLCLYSPVCVGPGRNPNCWFSHEAAQFLYWEFTPTISHFPSVYIALRVFWLKWNFRYPCLNMSFYRLSELWIKITCCRCC